MHAIEFSADRRWLATASEDHSARLFSLTGDETIVLAHDAPVRDVSVNADATRIATISGATPRGPD